jgi:hypothetical protein
MLTLTDYSHAIEQIEIGKGETDLDRDLALRSLVHEICGRPWDTAEERERAQVLVIRLERLRFTLTE